MSDKLGHIAIWKALTTAVHMDGEFATLKHGIWGILGIVSWLQTRYVFYHDPV